MAMHDYHEALPGFHEEQIFKDGCVECERRAADFEIALANMDVPTFERAWARGLAFEKGQAKNVSRAEAPVLRVLGQVHMRLQNVLLMRSNPPAGGPTDSELHAAQVFAQGLWESRSNQDIWTAIMDTPAKVTGLDLSLDYGELVNVAAEILERIQADPNFTVGDLTHEQVITLIGRKYPILVTN